jgi:hypothetical protein
VRTSFFTKFWSDLGKNIFSSASAKVTSIKLGIRDSLPKEALSKKGGTHIDEYTLKLNK